MERFTAPVYTAAMFRPLMIVIAFVAATALLMATPLVAIADTGIATAPLRIAARQ